MIGFDLWLEPFVLKKHACQDAFIGLQGNNLGLDESCAVPGRCLFSMLKHRRPIIKTTVLQFKKNIESCITLMAVSNCFLSHFGKFFYGKRCTSCVRDQQFQQMQKQTSDNPEGKEYLTNLLEQHEQANITENLSNIFKKSEHNVFDKINQGQLKIAQPNDKDKRQLMNNLLKKQEINPFESHYKGFFLNSDREKSHQRLQIFKKLKEEYSKEKTAIVVKEVQKKIKEWTAKKLEIEKKKERSRERENKIQMEMIEHLKRLQIQRREAEKEGRKQEVKNRLRMMEEKREERHQLMKQSSIRSLDVKEPRYKEMEDKFKEIQNRIKDEQERLLAQKRQAMIVQASEIQEHAKKYEEILKQREEQRKNRLKLKISEQQLENRESFNVFNNELREKKKEEQSKRKRMKEFQEKVKSVIIIKKKNEDQENEQERESNEKGKQKDKDKEKSRTPQQTDQIETVTPQGKRIRRKRRKIIQQVDGRKLGNDYLRSLKQKDRDLLNNSSRRSKILSSASLPVIKSTYKNYLTEVKIKRKPVGDEIEQLKRSCQNPKQVYEKLNEKSQAYEESMMKKINQLKKINKYDESVVRESEIDELYSRYIKVRIACIDS